jgi:hypothetical protein
MTIQGPLPPALDAAWDAALKENQKAADLYTDVGTAIEAFKKAFGAASKGKGPWKDVLAKFLDAGKALGALNDQIPKLEQAIDKFEQELQKIPVNHPDSSELNIVLKAFRQSPVIFKRAAEYYLFWK